MCEHVFDDEGTANADSRFRRALTMRLRVPGSDEQRNSYVPLRTHSTPSSSERPRRWSSCKAICAAHGIVK